MTQRVIDVSGLSKRFQVGAMQKRERTLQESILHAVGAPFRRFGGLLRGNAAAAGNLVEDYWALKDVSFSVDRGEIVAIIGRNGAGKSTLLKVLSRITEPTSGSAVIHGRVGSLLEVGTGFHPELTGRENVFLNGSILGMRRKEVERKFDEIVEFSEISQFIDTPVKHYSSGMRVRLAFSVAAHLEPEVMFVDEVLAVGDAGFRKKCLEKVRSISQGGSTVLVVTHNAQQVTSLCQRAVWLSKGQLVDDGDAAQVITRYLSENIGLSGERTYGPGDNNGGEIARVHAIRIRNARGEVTNNIDVRERFCVETELEVLKPGYGLALKCDVFNSDHAGAFTSVDTQNPTWRHETWPVGPHTLRMWVPENFLFVDTYTTSLMLWLWEPEKKLEFKQTDAVCVHVLDYLDGPTAVAGMTTGAWMGTIRPVMEWETTLNQSTARVAKRGH
jgi:lipopolysaccharide transport system ATP-binding protein